MNNSVLSIHILSQNLKINVVIKKILFGAIENHFRATYLTCLSWMAKDLPNLPGYYTVLQTS